jgi:D-alanyl-lipoteichoic acid acyltransferase DltB (MBOAT superfamily)
MLFNSYIFIFLFLPVTIFVYFWLNKKKAVVAAKVWLILASLFFYGYWNINYIILILVSIVFNYSLGDFLSSQKRGKSLLIFGVLSNIALLSYYKYSNFIIDNLSILIDKDVVMESIILPLAISFFTFQQIAYLVDSWKGETREHNFLNYTLFVVFFPQLIAGPIVHHKAIIPQFKRMRNLFINYGNLVMGLFVFSLGLFKKVVIADTLLVVVDNGFDHSVMLTFFESWIVSLSYMFQLYFDFSGYADMAIGLGLMFNIRLPINFNSPYKAVNIKDFWRRWHITLSSFLREYVYIPLGGNKLTKYGVLRNIVITFLIGGLWHGAGWTFIFWGLLHGIGVSAHYLWSRTGLVMNRIVARVITLLFINITWVFFRATEWNDAVKVLKGMFGFNGIGEMLSFKRFTSQFFDDFVIFIFIFILSFVLLFFKNSAFYLQHNYILNKKNIIYASLLLLISIGHLSQIHQFLYYQF